MSKQRKLLSYGERQVIEAELIRKKSFRKIGVLLCRSHTDISREVERNAGKLLPYSADRAQLRAEKRLLGKRRKVLETNIPLKKYVVGSLRRLDSPEQIAGRLRNQLANSLEQVSHETIYKFVYEEKELYKYLRTSRRKRRKRGKRKSRNRIVERVSIHQRLEEVITKSRYGDWETDTVESMRELLSLNKFDKIQNKRSLKKMADSPNFATTLAFSAIVFALAVTTAFLPSGGDKKDIRDFRIEHGLETESSAYSGTRERDIFDFLHLRINPVEIEPREEITRSKQSSNKKIVEVEQPEFLPLRSPQEFVIKVEDDTAEILEKSISFVEQEREIRFEAIRDGNIEGCAVIENARAKADCRGEIYFQKAVSENNSELCSKIENEKLRYHCQKYFQII